MEAMEASELTIALYLLGSLLAGGVIGIERSYHGRPAGFRTHSLVCLTSALLMMVTYYQWNWLPEGTAYETIRTDPTRMAQGIMTGIGFLGAGVIFKEGLSVRGLTTAASIWSTAGIGILIGIGFVFPAILAVVLTLCVLGIFRWIENLLPSHFYAHHLVRFPRHNAMSEEELREFVGEQDFTVANMSYRLTDDGQSFEYFMVIRTNSLKNMSKLAVAWRESEQVEVFKISPTGN